ncbi:unnamed protein product [Lactuca virosa]|uniref:NB-ARC domain-containing protein n=1 Tax=Lactuca virosa TaxID=75947 RepID=A0AAU9N7B9_9ASTR|nr:unnamed protein product [Lactuca virosa]
MDVATEIIKQVVQVLMDPVKQHLGYMISYRKYVVEMHTKMNYLNVARAGEKEHLDRNIRIRLMVPDQVSPWLDKIQNINAKVKNFPSEDLDCLDFKSRHKLGSKASKIINEIDSITTQLSLIKWTDEKIPLGRIDSTMTSTSTPSGDHNDFQSRVHTFTEALKALRPDHKPHMVALWGMGGVGKTTMMKKLRQTVLKY